MEESYLKAMLRKMGFSRSQLEKDCSDFSGGQKKKVLIAGSLCEAAHLYLWDEPLNDIDLFTRIQIEELLLAGKPTLVFVEHDEIFASKIATKAVNL
ncbi:MAG: ATP-binding cassette domain-containing protein [[Clostridium] leptum]